MMSTHTFAPPSLAPGANACQCSQVEWQLWWQSLANEGACQKNLEQQQWLQQVEAENNELTLLVEALRAEKRMLEQRLCLRDDELFEAKECLMAEFIQHRALQTELQREREICSGARCSIEKLQSMYEDACQQRDQEAMQVELCRQQLQRVETRNDELTVLVSAVEAEKERLEQQCSQEGSGASSPSQSTCDSDISPKEELPESAPHNEPAREADMGEVREGASSPVEMSMKACIPTFELPSLLQYLTVEDLLEWRLTSRQTASPRVLTHHLEEMGRLDRSESILEFSAQLDLAARDPNAFDAAGREADAETVKYFECRYWCMRLASARWTHFAESDARRIVFANLRHLLERCSDVNASVRRSAHHIVGNYGMGGLPGVKDMIAEAMLGRMEHLLEECTEISEEASTQVMHCSAHLEHVLRALEKPQRQKWVSLLVKVLLAEKSRPKTLINDLKLLWRADDDPGRSYAEAERQLVVFARGSGRGDMQNDLWDILHC